MNKIKRIILRIRTFIFHPTTLFYYKNFKGTIIYDKVLLRNSKYMRIIDSIICRNSSIKCFCNVQKDILLDFSNVYVSDNAYVSSNGNLIVKDATFAPGVFIGTYQHSITRRGKDANYRIIIEKPRLIGQNVSIFGNVTIGPNSVIGACSVVTKSVPKDSMVVGNPAKIIKKYDSECDVWKEV